MASDQCQRHPGERLRFVCQACTLPICRDCKMTRHEGHPTTDLDLAACHLREKLKEEREEVERRLRVVRLLEDKMSASIASFLTSMDSVQATVDTKADAVQEWAQRYRLLTERRLKGLRKDVNRDMKAALGHLTDNVRYLQQVSDVMDRALEEGASDQHVARVYADFRHVHKAGQPENWELSAHVAEHAWEMTAPCSPPDVCQAAIQAFLGLPLPARLVSTVPPGCCWSFCTRLCPADSCARRVTRLLPMADGSVSVLYSDGRSPPCLAHYAPDGQKRQERVVDGEGEEWGEVVMVELVNCQLALFSPTSLTWQTGAPRPPPCPGDPPAPPPTVLFLRPGSSGGSQVCEISYPLSGQRGEPSVLLDLPVKDAVRAVSSSSGRHLAVLRACQKVEVFSRQGGGALCSLHVRQALKQAVLTDLCFCRLQDREVLLLAESFHSVILVTDHLHDCLLTAFFPAPHPHPTCLSTDVAGGLWMGFEGGEVVAGVRVSGEEEEPDFEEDDEGYMVPADLYQDIMALGQPSPSPSIHAAEPEPPELPPKLCDSPSGGHDPVELPPPPPRRPGTGPSPRLRATLKRQLRTMLLPPDMSPLPPPQEDSPPDSPPASSPLPSPPPSAGALSSGAHSSEGVPGDRAPGGNRRRPPPPPPPVVQRVSPRHQNKEDWVPGRGPALSLSLHKERPSGPREVPIPPKVDPNPPEEEPYSPMLPPKPIKEEPIPPKEVPKKAPKPTWPVKPYTAANRDASDQQDG
ncbi:uncharacterized protein LOC143297019 [Babylonia areolata]|uniref:uncharacterized protein LOC143297019 n=1 Tax=Babylonia areolata TaxID=304850 RepID=UPI003FD47724